MSSVGDLVFLAGRWSDCVDNKESGCDLSYWLLTVCVLPREPFTRLSGIFTIGRVRCWFRTFWERGCCDDLRVFDNAWVSALYIWILLMCVLLLKNASVQSRRFSRRTFSILWICAYTRNISFNGDFVMRSLLRINISYVSIHRGY